MSKLIGTRKERVNQLAEQYLRHKSIADSLLTELKEEFRNTQGDFETDRFKVQVTEVTSKRFDKNIFIKRYGVEEYSACTKPTTAPRFKVVRK